MPARAAALSFGPSGFPSFDLTGSDGSSGTSASDTIPTVHLPLTNGAVALSTKSGAPTPADLAKQMAQVGAITREAD